MKSSLRNQHRPRKRFGQNFLIDQNIIAKIIHALNPSRADLLLEIGPGQAAITAKLLPLVKQLYAVEIDRDLYAQLTEHFGTKQNFCLYLADILSFDLKQIMPTVLNNIPVTSAATTSPKIRVIGNIPYNISTPLIFHLLKYSAYITDIHLMVQKEVANRLISPPGNKNYGRLTIMTQCCCDIEHLFDISPGSFTPAPAVQSSFIRMIPNITKKQTILDMQILQNITRMAFNKRRKTISNALSELADHLLSKTDKTALINSLLNNANIAPSLRPEQLTVDDYIKLSNIVVNDEQFHFT